MFALKVALVLSATITKALGWAMVVSTAMTGELADLVTGDRVPARERWIDRLERELDADADEDWRLP